jgi:hypothetical protein
MQIHAYPTWIKRVALIAALVLWALPAQGQDAAAKGKRVRPGRALPLQRDLKAPVGAAGFRQPEDWGFGGLHVLNLHPAMVTIPRAADDGGPQDFQVLTYNGRPFGPIIRARRGTTLRIRVRNHLHGPPGKDNPDPAERPLHHEPAHARTPRQPRRPGRQCLPLH